MYHAGSALINHPDLYGSCRFTMDHADLSSIMQIHMDGFKFSMDHEDLG
jgi:hypothetical protein